MASAVCLRCDWAGPAPHARSCPRCGVRLFLPEPAPTGATRPASPRPAPRPAAREDPLPRPAARDRYEALVVPARSRPTTPRSRARGWVALALAAILIATAGLTAGSGGGGQQRDRAVDRVDRPPPGRFVALPPGLGDLTASDPITVTFASVQPEGSESLYRLWRLEMPTGGLVPGPVVGKVLQIAHAPAPHEERIAYVVDGGGLFVLDGFVGRRPTWIAGGIQTFDFDHGGNLVFATAIQRPDPEDGTTVTEVRSGRVERGEQVPSLERVEVVDYPARRMAVRRGTVYLWGTKNGGQVLTAIDPRRPRRVVERPMGTAFVEDVGPGGLALVSPSAAPSVVLSPTSRARPALSLGVRVHRVLAWGDGTLAAFAGSPMGSASRLYVIPLTGGEVRVGGTGAGPAQAGIGLSPDETLVAWTEGREIRVAAGETGRTVVVGLPEDLPDPLGPLAVG